MCSTAQKITPTNVHILLEIQSECLYEKQVNTTLSSVQPRTNVTAREHC